MLSFPGWWFQIRQGLGVAFLAIKAGWKQQPGKWPFVSFALFGFKNIDEVEPPSAWQFDWGKPPVFSPACETTTASPSPSTVPTVPSPAAAVPNRATVPPSRWVNVTAALYPLDSRYVASSKACPAACLGKPGKDCEKRYCCKAKGSADTFETLSYEHVAFLRIRCQGNINHDFHQSFWPFFWWTAVYNNSDFAILVDRMAKHPNTSCPAAYWLDDLFWALSKANGWKVHNFSSTKEYCITGELHILEGQVLLGKVFASSVMSYGTDHGRSFRPVSLVVSSLPAMFQCFTCHV